MEVFRISVWNQSDSALNTSTPVQTGVLTSTGYRPSIRTGRPGSPSFSAWAAGVMNQETVLCSMRTWARSQEAPLDQIFASRSDTTGGLLKGLLQEDPAPEK